MPRSKRTVAIRDPDDAEKPSYGDQDEGGRLWCNCDRRCNGGKYISRPTWYRHKRFQTAGDSDHEDTNLQHDFLEGGGSPQTHTPERDNLELDSAPSQSPRFAAAPLPAAPHLFASPARDRTAGPQQQNSPPLPGPAAAPGGAIDPGSLADLARRDAMEEEEEEGEDEDEETGFLPSSIADIATTQEFIARLKAASLDNGDLDEAQLFELRNPSSEPIDLESPETRITQHCIRIFLATRNGSQDSYTQVIESSRNTYPAESHLYLSLDQVKRRIASLSGVYAVEKDMCRDSCVAFTGPFENLQNCPVCHAARFDDQGKPVQTFDTILLGPQIQALRRHPDRAKAMRYFMERVRALLALRGRGQFLETFDDLTCGEAILSAVQDNKIGDFDTLLAVSMDGAQLYRNKTSDCWIYMWSVLNFAPVTRFKQGYLLPGSFIPGKPKHIDSFLFVGFYHLAAINNAGGLHVYDAALRTTYQTLLLVILALADAVAAVHFSGLVPHHGKFGCRLFCGLPGRHKPGRGGAHYYPALLKPTDYTMAGCDHDDVDIRPDRPPNAALYRQKLESIISAPNDNAYETRRRDGGVSKPSILWGLEQYTPIGLPGMCPGDAMHEILNLADLFVNLLRGTIDCGAMDDSNSWAWAVLKGEIWEQHGRDVALCIHFLPGSFGRGPRNPALKINSGYKAWEHLLYLFSLGPGLFLGIIPMKYYRTYCKLVAGVRLLYQKRITRVQIERAKQLLLEFTYEFEALFCERRIDRLHFVRQSIHNLSHWAPETFRLGPSACFSQWTMERFIGLATAELKQHSNPYKNLSRRGLERAQLNALKAAVPGLDREAAREGTLPMWSKPIPHDYVLLRALEQHATPITDPEYTALHRYFAAKNLDIPPDWHRKICRWSRLRLPNCQVARSLWKEQLKSHDNLRRARDVKLFLDAQLEFAEVRYYFEFIVGDEAKILAMVSLCTRPDRELLELSSGTLWSCQHQGDAGLRVVEYTSIAAVVAMPPHSTLLGDGFRDRVFVAEMPGLDVAEMGGAVEPLVEEEDD